MSTMQNYADALDAANDDLNALYGVLDDYARILYAVALTIRKNNPDKAKEIEEAVLNGDIDDLADWANALIASNVVKAKVI